MEYRKYGNLNKAASALGLGSWPFGGDFWWGDQSDRDSLEVLQTAFEGGINLIDTAPIYGNGHSEEVVGKFIKEGGLRKKIILATKLGLDPNTKGYHNLKKDRMLREIDESLKRLQTDYIDLYQIHWPDPNLPVGESAEMMRNFYERGLIKSVGVSNYSVAQMREFMKYCPLHSLQPPYNMFRREIENEIIPFCAENNISIISYSPLHGAVLTGKYFFDGVKIPGDAVRKNLTDLKVPFFAVNKKFLAEIKKTAEKYGKTLTQFVLNWTMTRKGIGCVLIGARNKKQIEENLKALGWSITACDLASINKLLSERDSQIAGLANQVYK